MISEKNCYKKRILKRHICELLDKDVWIVRKERFIWKLMWEDIKKDDAQGGLTNKQIDDNYNC